MKAIIIFLISFPSFVFGKTIFEPNLSINRGSFEGPVSGSDQLTNGTEAAIDFTTFSAGARYGITREYIHVTGVVDVFLIDTAVGSLSGGQTIETEMDIQFNYGIGLGYEWNIPIRTYLILGIPTSSLEISYFYSESLLIGFKYNRMSVNFAGGDLDTSTFGATLSFPIEFEYPSFWWRKKDWE